MATSKTKRSSKSKGAPAKKGKPVAAKKVAAKKVATKDLAPKKSVKGGYWVFRKRAMETVGPVAN